MTDETDADPATEPQAATDGTALLVRFEMFRDRADEWRWRLRHRNGNAIATSGEGRGARGTRGTTAQKRGCEA
jgi:hypothetical protein